MSPIKTLLVPVDSGAPSEAALAYAVDLAEGLGARIYLVHGYELPIIGLPDGTVVATAEIASSITKTAQDTLDRAMARCEGHKVEVTPLLKQGNPKELILGLSQELGADLVVMGTHGRRGVVRALIGSVTESVVRTSTIPVLTVHETPHAAAA
jgi:nucleotide-binding universal stress UspA family protein